MSDEQLSFDALEEKKQAIRVRLRAGTADGIIGVGLNSVSRQLVVFYSDRDRAVAFLSVELGESWDSSVELVDCSKTSEDKVQNSEKRQRWKAFFVSVFRLFSREIKLGSGARVQLEGGEPGTLGCFVELANGDVVGMISEHVCHRRDKHGVHETFSSDKLKAGSVEGFGGLMPMLRCNVADAAFFRREKDVQIVSPMKIMSGRYVTKTNLGLVNKLAVTAVTQSEEEGRVVDISADHYRCAVLGDQGRVQVLMCDQLLIKSNQSFALGGDSGAVVILISDSSVPSSAKKGDVVGVFSYKPSGGSYYFLAPFEACLTAIGGKKIFSEI